MAKKIIENQRSKFAVRTANRDGTRERLGLIVRRSPTLFPKSFRLKSGDLERLSAIMAKLKEQYPDKNFGETDVIRGLLVIGEKVSSERLLAAIREAML